MFNYSPNILSSVQFNLFQTSKNIDFKLFSDTGIKTVLIADEEAEVRDALSVAVRRWAQEEQRNLDTIMVENGQRAVDYVQKISNQNQLFLTILDLRMPKMNGLEAAKTINKLYPQIPIIITASYDEIDKQLIQEADDFANQNSHIGFVIRAKSSPLLKVALEFEIRQLLSSEKDYEEENIDLLVNLKGKLSNLLLKAF